MLDTIIDIAADLCQADMSVVRLMRDGVMHHVASGTRNDPVVDDHSKSHPILRIDRSSVAGRVALEGRTIHIPDVVADPEYTYLGALSGSRVGAALGVPLLHEAKVVGAIILLRKAAGPFSARQIALVETFADQAVIAIENVRLFEEVQARNREISEALEQQTATGAILRVIAASPTDIQPVLQVVAESAARFCDTHDAVIFLAEEGDLVVKAHYGPVPVGLCFDCRSATVRSPAAHMPSARHSTSTTSSPAVTNFPKAKRWPSGTVTVPWPRRR